MLHLSALLTVALAINQTGAPQKKPAPYTVTLPKSVAKINMVPIPAGTVNGVKVKPFYIATTETPWEAFDVFLGSGPESKPYDQTAFAPDAIARPSRSYILPDLGWGHRGYPAINLSFTNVEMYCRWMSSVTGKKYRVPTESEWELACRAGVAGPWKMSPADVEKVAWFAGNSEEMTHPVATKAANKFGLFDMLGNAGEWATDDKGLPVLCGPSFRDPIASVTPTLRKRWEPAWQDEDPQIPKSRWWLSDAPFAGFRVVCEG